MTPASTAVSLSVPLTENTAEVREYRCLFTTDLRRKQKRWQDGFLNFHTFNNRICVYDESRNRVGDTFWRKEFGFGEGEELKLQQNVLIEVGEILGSKEQDVSGVVVTRDTSRNSQIPSSRPSPWKALTTIGPNGSGPRTTMTVASGLLGQKPKTLQEVLSTPRGALGRASMSDSPYERRRTRTNTSPDAHVGREPVVICKVPGALKTAPAVESTRPKKKQKTSDADNGTRTPAKTASTGKTPNANRRKATSPMQSLSRNHASNPILIESEEEMSDLDTPWKQSSVPKSASKNKPPQNLQATAAPVVSKNSGSSAKALPGSEAVVEQELDMPLARLSKSDERRVLRERPTNTLKSASTQPRRKLMYRDLLPSSFVSKKTKSQATRRDPGSASLASPLKYTSPLPGRHSPTPDHAINEISEEDMLLFSNPPLENKGPLQEDTSTTVQHGTAPHSSTKAAHQLKVPVPEPVPTIKSDSEIEASLEPGIETFVTEDEPTLAELDQAFVAGMRQQQALYAASHLNEPPNVLGEEITTTVTKAALASARMILKSPRRGPLQRIQTDPSPKFPQGIQRRSPFKKTVSDTAGTNQQPPEPVIAPDPNNVKGPWSREAFDLFGWRTGDSKEVITRVALRRGYGY